MSALPGAEFAAQNGYELQRHGGDGGSATYLRRLDGESPIYLTCYRDGTATLERILGLVVCRIEKFTYPGNFKIFEKHISQIYLGVPQ